jgi:hypothetical protein
MGRGCLKFSDTVILGMKLAKILAEATGRVYLLIDDSIGEHHFCGQK